MAALRRWLLRRSSRRADVPTVGEANPATGSTADFEAAARERGRRSPLIHLQFYFELPFDVGIETGAFNRIQLSHPCLEDWAGFDLQAFLGMPPLPEPCVRPCIVLRFKRASRPDESPFADVRRAYGPELGSAIPSEAELNALETSVSVVKAEVIASGASGEFDEQWLRAQFRTVLVKLNEMLIALSAAADEHRISPITEFDLPPIILGWQQDLRDLDAPSKKPRLFFLLLHEGRSRQVADHDSTIINRALAVAGHGDHGPFFSTMEMLFAARRSLESGRFAAAVLESGTAVELLVSDVVRGVGMSQSWDRQRLENVLSDATGFRNRFVAHFARALGVSVDASASGDDPVSTWLRVAYPLRNRVVHRGHRPVIEEAASAIGLAFSLMDFVAERVERDPSLGITFPDIDEMLPGPGVDERSLAHRPPSERRLAQESFDAGLRAVADHDEVTAIRAFEESYNHGSPKPLSTSGSSNGTQGTRTKPSLGFAAHRSNVTMVHPHTSVCCCSDEVRRSALRNSCVVRARARISAAGQWQCSSSPPFSLDTVNCVKPPICTTRQQSRPTSRSELKPHFDVAHCWRSSGIQPRSTRTSSASTSAAVAPQ